MKEKQRQKDSPEPPDDPENEPDLSRKRNRDGWGDEEDETYKPPVNIPEED